MNKKIIGTIILTSISLMFTSCDVKPMGKEDAVTTKENKGVVRENNNPNNTPAINTQDTNSNTKGTKPVINFKNEDEKKDFRSEESKKLISSVLNVKTEGEFANYEDLRALEDGEDLNAAIWDLSKSVYGELNKDKEKQNIIFSPMALFNDVALLRDGATGETRDALSTILKLDSKEETTTVEESEDVTAVENEVKAPDKNRDISQSISPLVKLFNNKFLDENQNPNRNGMALSTGLFIQNGQEFNRDFLQKITDVYAAEAFNVDFNNKDAVKEILNAWIKERSKGFMEGKSEVSDGTTFQILNLFSINSKWYDSYYDGEEIDFSTLKGESKRVPSMKKTNYTTFIENKENYVAYLDRLRGAGDVWFIMPKDGKSLDDISMDDIKKTISKDSSSLEHVILNVTLPQFKIMDGELELKDVLANAGYTKLIGGDYSNIAKDAKIGSIKQQYKMIVDSIGVRQGEVNDISENGQNVVKNYDKVELTFNKPFIMVIESYNYPQYIIKVGDPTQN